METEEKITRSMNEKAKERRAVYGELDNEQRIKMYTPYIQKALSKVIPNYKNYVEREDLEQELYAFVLYRQDTIPREGEVRWLPSFFYRVAKTLAYKEKQRATTIDASQSYKLADMRHILQTHFDQELWDAVAEGESVEDQIAVHSDIAWSLNKMTLEKRLYIREAYTNPAGTPKSGSAEYRKLREHLIELTNIANGYLRRDEAIGGPGARTAVSNTKARAMIDDTWFSDKFGRAGQ